MRLILARRRPSSKGDAAPRPCFQAPRCRARSCGSSVGPAERGRARPSELLATVRADARGELGLALLLKAAEPAAPGALGRVREEAREHLVDEELHVGAPLRDAVGDARHAEIGRVRLEIDALDRAADDLEARLRHALSAVLRADRAGL